MSGQLVSNGAQDFVIVEALLGTLLRGGFTGRRLVDAYDTVLGWLVGFVGVELAPAPASGARWAARRERDLRDIDESKFPLLGRYWPRLTGSFAVRWHSGSEAPMDRAFAASLRVLLRGLRQPM